MYQQPHPFSAVLRFTREQSHKISTKYQKICDCDDALEILIEIGTFGVEKRINSSTLAFY